MRNISQILFIFLSLMLISCSSSNDDSSPQLNDDDVVNSLELYISADEVTHRRDKKRIEYKNNWSTYKFIFGINLCKSLK